MKNLILKIEKFHSPRNSYYSLEITQNSRVNLSNKKIIPPPFVHPIRVTQPESRTREENSHGERLLSPLSEILALREFLPSTF